jgi:hypothetical protein
MCGLCGGPWGHSGAGLSRGGLSLAHPVVDVGCAAVGWFDVPFSGGAGSFWVSEPACTRLGGPGSRSGRIRRRGKDHARISARDVAGEPGPLFFLGALGVLFGAAVFLGAPLLVQLALGPDFHGAVPVLRVFSLWIPLTGLCTVVTFQLILPSQLDNQFNIVNFTAALVIILAALLLGPRHGAIGIAWSAVIGQIYTLLAFAVILWRAGLNPFPVSIASAVHPRPVG